MKIGYIRTSTADQNLDRQKKIMQDYKVDMLFSEQESGKDTNRPALNKMLKSIQPNDEIVISSLDRLSRNYKDSKEIIQIIKDKGATLTIVDAPFLNFNTGNSTLDTAMFDIFLSLLGYIAQNEREKILERQRQGIEQAKLKGVYNGRPIKYHAYAKNPQDKFIYECVISMLENKKPIQSIARQIGISKSTVYEIKKRST
ncbi:recombinase family protein [Gemella cuniculi]|uniref:recombinase family protein n=1 Tax=Gemella cuniculi TaxID=150240 RepID=UPI0003F532D4|nr:recombinase family protein [Gemella cuniculi]